MCVCMYVCVCVCVGVCLPLLAWLCVPGPSCTGNMIFFGCRSEHADFFFADEWLPLESEGSLRLFAAFSRDQGNKVYVQHKITEQGELVWKWLSEMQAYVFIAG